MRELELLMPASLQTPMITHCPGITQLGSDLDVTARQTCQDTRLGYRQEIGYLNLTTFVNVTCNECCGAINWEREEQAG